MSAARRPLCGEAKKPREKGRPELERPSYMQDDQLKRKTAAAVNQGKGSKKKKKKKNKKGELGGGSPL